MANRIEPFIRHLRKVLRPTGDPRLTDSQLLGQYVAAGDERAFEALVHRHGKMVFALCLRLLRNTHDAEDAFQATFLVLTRKAASVSPREALGNWLYGVACRTAHAARVRNARRRSREQQVADIPQPATEEAAWQKLVPFLDQELIRLPEKYRLPVVLCELEGRPRKEVAHQLGIPEGTLSSRLATARKMLAKRLAKYGPSSGAVLATVFSQAAEASIPSTLVSSTLKAALGGSSATVVALAQGVLKAMFISKLKTVSLVMALAMSITVGAVGLTSAQQKAANPAPAVADLAGGDEKGKTPTLTDAVKEFNQRAQKDATGKDQPALTDDEVVAAIRGWNRERVPATDEVYNVYQKIADTKKLPEGATLTFNTKWSGFNKHEFDVWWVDLNIKTGVETGYTFRIRDQKLRCRRLKNP